MRDILVLMMLAGTPLALAGCSGDYDAASLPPEVEPSPGPGGRSPESGRSPAVPGGETGVDTAGAGLGPGKGLEGGMPAGPRPMGSVASRPGGPQGGDRATSERPFAPPHRAGSSQPSPQDAAPHIGLARGIALPQTGPEGTMMGFHLEYRWERGQPEPGRRYFLVIQRARGTAIRQPVQLESEGSWDGFALRWRPEEGPFQAHIEDDRGNRLSRSLPLD